MKVDFIKQYWEENAKKYGNSLEASWGDYHMINLEIGIISEQIKEGDNILDVGCANGYSAFKQLDSDKKIRITGIDFSEQMIKSANNKKNTLNLKSEVKFEIGDVRQLNFNDNTFDVVYTTRVLINLPNWDQQKKGIEECIRVAKPGGKIIFCEAFWEPLIKLNAIRSIENLEPLVEHDFNRYIKKINLNSFLKEKHLFYNVNVFSSVYYLGSRFLRELVTNPSDFSGYTNPVNEDFFLLEKKYSGGDFGIQQAYIVIK